MTQQILKFIIEMINLRIKDVKCTITNELLIKHYDMIISCDECCILYNNKYANYKISLITHPKVCGRDSFVKLDLYKNNELCLDFIHHEFVGLMDLITYIENLYFKIHEQIIYETRASKVETDVWYDFDYKDKDYSKYTKNDFITLINSLYSALIIKDNKT